MLIYTIILAFIILIGLILKVPSGKNKRLFLVIVFIVLIVLAGVRSKNVGKDTLQYYRAYDRIQYLDMSIEDFSEERYEIGFTALCKILNLISTNPQLLILVTSIFINLSVARFIYKNSDNVFFSTILYIILNFYFSYMNIMRQAIAVAFLLFAFEEAKKQKNIRALILIAIATTFHASAILGLCYILLRKFEYKDKYNIVLIPLLIITFAFGRNILVLLANNLPRLAVYLGSEYDTSNYFGALINFGIYLIILMFGNNILKHKKNISKDDKIFFMKKMLIINLIFSVLTIRVNIFDRFMPFFSIFEIIWLPNILALMKKNRNLYTISFFMLFASYWIVIMLYRPEWYGVIPYQIGW